MLSGFSYDKNNDLPLYPVCIEFKSLPNEHAREYLICISFSRQEEENRILNIKNKLREIKKTSGCQLFIKENYIGIGIHIRAGVKPGPVKISFDERVHAEYVNSLLQNSVNPGFQFPKVELCEDAIVFNETELTNPKFSVAKRMKAEWIITRYTFAYFALQNLNFVRIPLELINKILSDVFDSFDFTNIHLEHVIKLNQEFALPNDPDLRFEPVNCSAGYGISDIGKNEYNFYLICPDRYDAVLLDRYFEYNKFRMAKSQEKNILKITPCKTLPQRDLSYCITYNDSIQIIFDRRGHKESFLNMIKITNASKEVKCYENTSYISFNSFKEYLIDIDMQRSYKIHIEYECDNNNDEPVLFFSTSCVDDSKHLFKLMDKRWKLPVEFKDNQIILRNQTSPGIKSYLEYLHITLGGTQDAKNFWKLLASNATYLPRMVYFQKENIVFDKISLIHKNFSREKRIKAQLVNQYIFMHLVLQLELPKDLSKTIVFLFILMENQNLIPVLSREFLDRTKQLSNEFILPLQILPRQSAKIVCEVKYSNTKYGLALTLSCPDRKFIDVLRKDYLDKQCLSEFFIDKNKIEVNKVKNTINESTQETMSGIIFDNTENMERFLNRVSFTIPYLIMDNHVYFSINSMEKINNFEINFLPACKNIDSIAINDDMSTMFYQTNRCKGFISIKEIKTLSDDAPVKEPIIKEINDTRAIFDFIHANKVNPLIVIPVKNFIFGDYTNCVIGIEKEVIAMSNANAYMPAALENSVVESVGGIYTITKSTIKRNNMHAKVSVDFAFVALPDMAKTESNYFSRESYLKHVTSLAIIQFYLARFSNNMLITGRQGCEFLNNKDEDIAAIIWAVNQMPEFRNIQVIFTIHEKFGKTETYKNPDKEKMQEVNNCINIIRMESNLNITKLAKNIQANYISGKNVAKTVFDISQYLDENMIEKINSFAWNGLALFSNNDARNNEIKTWINNLKNELCNGLQNKMDLGLIIYIFKENNPLNCNANIITKIDDELDRLVSEFGNENKKIALNYTQI